MSVYCFKQYFASHMLSRVYHCTFLSDLYKQTSWYKVITKVPVSRKSVKNWPDKHDKPGNLVFVQRLSCVLEFIILGILEIKYDNIESGLRTFFLAGGPLKYPYFGDSCILIYWNRKEKYEIFNFVYYQSIQKDFFFFFLL